MLGRLRFRIAADLYYSTWPVLIGWNPTNFCNRLYRPKWENGSTYAAFGGARWDNPWGDLAFEDEPGRRTQSLPADAATPVDLPASDALDLVIDLNGRRNAGRRH